MWQCARQNKLTLKCSDISYWLRVSTKGGIAEHGAGESWRRSASYLPGFFPCVTLQICFLGTVQSVLACTSTWQYSQHCYFSGLFAWHWIVLDHLLASRDSCAAGFCNRFPTLSLWALENHTGRRQPEHFHLCLISDAGWSPGAVKLCWVVPAENQLQHFSESGQSKVCSLHFKACSSHSQIYLSVKLKFHL